MLIAIDGGGSKNDLILFTDDGTILNRVIGKGSNISEMGPEAASERMISQLKELLEGFGGLDAEISALFAGMSGGGAVNSRQLVIERLQAALPNTKGVHISGDTVTALYAGVGTGDGMAVIAGTGTSEYVRYGGDNYTMVGGWGHLIDDSGSGFWLGKEAVNAALRELDGRGKPTLITTLVNEKLGKSVRSSISYLYSDGKRTIASFAPVIFEAARQNDEVALEIMNRGADELELMIRAGAKLIGHPPYKVALVGGLWNADIYQNAVRARLDENYILSQVTAPPVIGAALAAAEKAGIEVTEEFREKLVSGLKEAE
ncbi:MAG: hypothetical protein IJE08_10775 [Clostridia bacterium]|nr:hypothetical protein [Clostridia bacterium]